MSTTNDLETQGNSMHPAQGHPAMPKANSAAEQTSLLPTKSNPDEAERDSLAKARESFSGRLLTDSQFDEAIAITQILEREVYKSGSFKDKLQDYSYAMARSEKLDSKRLETTIRDLFKERTGRTMNQMREELKAREDRLDDADRDQILMASHEVEVMMANGDKITFNRALAEKAQTLAEELNITDNGAKKLMADTFDAEQSEDGPRFYEWGEALDEQYYRPQIEAEKQARAEAKQQDLTDAGIARPRRRR